MSSITASSYRVETAEEISLRERRVAQARYAAMAAELELLRREATMSRKVFGHRVAEVPAVPRAAGSATAAELNRLADEAAALLRRSRAELGDARGAAARQQVGALLGDARSRPRRAVRDDAAEAGQHATRLQEEARAADRTAQHGAERHRRLAEQAAGELARLPGDADGALRDRCTRTVTAIVAEPGESRARLLLADLRDRVDADVERAAAVSRVAGELGQLAGRLAGLRTADALALQRRIADLLRDPAIRLPAGLTAEVDAAVAAADRPRHRRAAAAALRLSLADLDYTVDEGFETVLVDNGVAYARIPGDDGHAVKLLLDSGTDAFRTVVVRSDERSRPAEDTAAERRFCRDYRLLLDRARRYGLAAATVGLVEPGTHPLAVVAEDDLPARAAAASRQQQTRAKERGR